MKKFFYLVTILSFNLFGNSQIINMEKVGRTYRIPCTINGLNLKFILDTGADAVSISLSEAIFMIKNGYIKEDELLNTEYYRLANGDIAEGTRIIIRTIEIGGLTIRNVEASIVHELEAPLLFGQSALEKLGKITIDYSKNQLKIGEQKEVYGIPKGSSKDYFLSGCTKQNDKDYKGAIIEFNKALELNPDFPEAHFYKGVSKDQLGDYRGALLDYNKAISLNPKYFQAYLNRGTIKDQLKDYNNAIADYKKVAELNPSFYKAYYNIGNTNIKLQNFKEAIVNFNKAIEIYPKDSSSYVNRGIAKSILGDVNGACLDWSKAGELGSDKAYNLIKEYCN